MVSREGGGDIGNTCMSQGGSHLNDSPVGLEGITEACPGLIDHNTSIQGDGIK